MRLVQKLPGCTKTYNVVLVGLVKMGLKMYWEPTSLITIILIVCLFSPQCLLIVEIIIYL